MITKLEHRPTIQIGCQNFRHVVEKWSHLLEGMRHNTWEIFAVNFIFCEIMTQRKGFVAQQINIWTVFFKSPWSRLKHGAIKGAEKILELF